MAFAISSFIKEFIFSRLETITISAVQNVHCWIDRTYKYQQREIASLGHNIYYNQMLAVTCFEWVVVLKIYSLGNYSVNKTRNKNL